MNAPAVSESDVHAVVISVIVDHPEKLVAYQKGDQTVFGFFVGQVMKRMDGQVDARLVSTELQRSLVLFPGPLANRD